MEEEKLEYRQIEGNETQMTEKFPASKQDWRMRDRSKNVKSIRIREGKEETQQKCLRLLS